jgi:PilZ domain-containing protein
MSFLQVIARLRPSFIEQRRSTREHVDFPAWIESDFEVRSRECTVLDVSDGGARIMVSQRTRVPAEFWLVFSRDGKKRRRCRMVWRSDDQIGLSYLGPLQSGELTVAN